ncbi:MAG: amidohydrolase family protein [Blastocatellia bacterium]|nr:amidohydrolase family protein [Blastocatellia bacterium]MCS7157080.1 amidohydrolase family protein [Blastocatellia bacterium]MCX7752281.1 amidohydrolase family protein [Blastocatellia bacterium]MDW8167773.1 amidohydrolase family protein [Acidobacteriota bacterium]MDW8256594.1 amidohydrolase family protein [Acidobacteriota bacterium]
MSSARTLYVADWVVPIARPPFRRGGIAVEGERIVAVGSEAELRARFPEAAVRDFGEAALLPGLVNVHAHLELTVFRGMLEDLSFVRWLAALTRLREGLSVEEVRESARAGVLEAIRSGQTTIVDVGATGVGFEALCESGARGLFFQEVFGLRPEDAEEGMRGLSERLQQMRAHSCASERVRLGISPHAPYTVSAPLFRRAVEYARANSLPLCIHIAESRAEVEFVRYGRGEFAQIYERRGLSWRAPGISPIQYLHDLGVLAARPLLVHGVYVDGDDIALIAQSGAAIAHCPKSNAKLGHGVAPLPEWLRAGIAVGLGTDSVASNNACDLLEEARFGLLMQRANRASPTLLSAEAMLRLLTLGGARALSLESRIGSLEPGKEADFIAVDLSGAHVQPVDDPVAAIVFSARGSDVRFTAVGGRVLFDGVSVTTLDEERVRARLQEIRARARHRQALMGD